MFLKSVLAGLAISIGGTIYLSVENNVVGALFFSIGLLIICLFDWNLYTGKCCMLIDRGFKYLNVVVITFFGNLLGCIITAYTLRFTHLSKLIPYASETSLSKTDGTLFSHLIMGICCGLMVYVAVFSYKHIKDSFGKYFLLVLPIIVFTVAGFQHVVANMFYFSFSNTWNSVTIINILIVGLGNLIGCITIPAAQKYLYSDRHR